MPLNIGIVGAGPQVDFIADCYRGLPGVAGVAVQADHRLLLEKADALELAAPTPDLRTIVEDACVRGRHLALPVGWAADRATVEAVATAVRRSGVCVVVLDSLLHHPFIRQALDLLSDEAVGEIQMIRIKTNLGGSADLAGDAPLADAAFDKAALVEALGGRVAEVFCYGTGGARMVSYKFATPGRYGIHEAVHSPDLLIRGEGRPLDEAVEITGTDGILWLRNLSAMMVEAPKLMLKRKDRVTVWDDKTSYNHASRQRELRAHFLACLTGKATPIHSLDQSGRAAELNLAAAASREQGRPITL